MLQEIEEITPTTKRLKINIPSSVIEEEVAKAYNHLRATARIPGFRVGKVPQAILEKRFGKDVENEIIGKVVPDFYSQAINEAKIIPVTYPEIDGNLKIIKNQPLSFTATVEIKPEIKDLDYNGIRIKEKTFSVDEDEVEKAIELLRENRAVLKVYEGSLREGDIAIIDYSAFIDGKEVKELSRSDYPFVINTQALPEEFSSALLGRKKGDNLEVKVAFEASHPNKTIAGKEVLFNVRVTETKEKVLPQLDDDFAKGFECTNIDEFRKKIYENIYNRKKSQIENEYKKELIDYLTNHHSFEVPDSMLKREIDFLTHEAKQNISDKDANEKEIDENKARNNIKGSIILEAIGKKEKVEVSEEDVKKAIDEIAAQNGIKPEDVRKIYIMKNGSLDGLRNKLYTDKVLDLILAGAVIENDKTESSK